MDPNPWVKILEPSPLARLRLFCLPFAGGGALFYRSWPAELPNSIEVCSVQLPGRERRLREKPIRRLEVLVHALAEALSGELATPFMLFGHSMGALLCFELARKFRRDKSPEPVHLFLSGRIAPHLPDPRPPIHRLPEQEFVRELQRLGGTPREVLESSELMEMMIPMLRADFEIYETYTHQPEPPLSCPISAYGGLQDPDHDRQGIEAWRQHTHGSFHLQMFPGAHFFLQTARRQFRLALRRDIEEVIKTNT